MSKDAWNVEIYAKNPDNSHAGIFTNSDQFIVAQTVLRPRVMGVSFGHEF